MRVQSAIPTTVIVLVVLCLVHPTYSDGLLRISIYDFNDGTQPMVIRTGTDWKVARDDAGTAFFYRTSWRDSSTGKLLHWMDRDGFPHHRYQTEAVRNSAGPVTVYRLLTYSLNDPNFYSRDSREFERVEEAVGEALPEEVTGVLVEEQEQPPLPPEPLLNTWPRPFLTAPLTGEGGQPSCLEDRMIQYTCDVDMSPADAAPQWEFISDRYTWIFLNPWNGRPNNAESYPGPKQYGVRAFYTFAVPASSADTLERDRFKNEVYLELDLFYQQAAGSEGPADRPAIRRKALPPPAETFPVMVQDVTTPSEVILTVPARQFTSQPFSSSIGCRVEDNNPNLEQVPDRLMIDLRTTPSFDVYLSDQLVFDNYTASGFGEGATEDGYYSIITCDTNTGTPPALKSDFKGFIKAWAETSEGFGGTTTGEASELIRVYDVLRPQMTVILEDRARGLKEVIGPISPGEETDPDMLALDMPGHWFEKTRYLLTIKISENIEQYNDSAQPGNVKAVPNKHLQFAGYWLGGELQPSPGQYTDITEQIIATGKADFLELQFRTPDVYYLWIFAEDAAAEVPPESYRNNCRILKLRIEVHDTIMRTEEIDFRQ